MIRIGYRGYGAEGNFKEDRYFRTNINNAKKVGIKVGIYFFTQAVTEAEAIQEANWTINKIREIGYTNSIDYPIAIDTESSSEGHGNGRADKLDVGTRTTVCKAFCQTIESNGYIPMIYASRDWFYYNLDIGRINQYDTWVAHYTNSAEKPTNYKYHYEIWQYTSAGQVMGIQTGVDLNIGYKKY